MGTTPPPPRYRVVEQGRRLVVIDTLTGAPVEQSVAAKGLDEMATPTSFRPSSDADRHGGSSSASRIARAVCLVLSAGATTHDGHPIIATKAFYDDNSPREIVLHPAAQRRIGYGALAMTALLLAAAALLVTKPFALVPLLALASEVVQGWIRRRTTHWLDEIDGGYSTG